MSSPPLLATLGACAAAGLVALSGCGGSEAVPARGSVVELRLTDYRVQPLRISARRGRLTFRVRNAGRLPHNLHVERDGLPRLELKTMLPGGSRQGTVRLRRGRFRLVCTIANHEELGMWATLEVR